MQRILLSGILLVFLLQMHQIYVSIGKGTHASYANDELMKNTTTTPKNRDRNNQEFPQDKAEDVSDIEYLKDEKHMPHPSEKTNIFHASNTELKAMAIESTTENQVRSMNWRERDQVDHPRKKWCFANMDFQAPNSKATTMSKTNIFEVLEVPPETEDDGSQLASNQMRQNQQQSNMRNLRSPRQRRTAQTVQSSEKSLVCQEELSCRNKCQNPRRVLYETRFLCFCDEDCESFQDCCADYDDFCGTNGQTNSTIRNKTTTEILVTQENKDLWRCYIGKELKGTLGIWMIGSCPSSWPEDDVLYRCRNLSETNTLTEDNYRYLPVYTSNGRVYHNRFCAQCNGVSPKGLREYTLSFECYFRPPRYLNFERTISHLFSNCKEKLGTKLIYWSPRKGDPRRYCLYVTQPNRCFTSFNASLILTKCLTGKPRIVTSLTFYRNIDCAKCHEEIDISCGPNITASTYNEEPPWQISMPPKPLSVIFDFNNDNSKGLDSMEIETSCPDNKVFDHYLDLCRDAIPALPSLSDWYEYQVVLWLEPFPLVKKVDQADDRYHQAIAQALTVPISNVKNIEIHSNISFILQIRKKESLQTNVQNLLDFTSPFKLIIPGMVHTVLKASARILGCVNWQKYNRNEYTVLQKGSSAVSIKKTGEVFQSTDYYLNTTDAKASANDSQAIFVCRQHQISKCLGVYIIINEGDFRVLMNKSIFVNASKQVYDWPEYTWTSKSVLVCENFSTTYHKSKLVSNDDPVLTTLTIVCMSLSIIGLVFVLVTYSLFSELRTPPGINLMNLSVSILLAQLLWLLGSGQTDTPMACTVIAVILHYLFLVSFVWTSIIAFDTWRAFSGENRSSESQRDKCVRVFRQVVVGWLPVLVYVSVCIALDFTDTVNIGYNSRTACWMANKWAILYFFAVPVFIFLVFNIVFCVLTFRAIKVTTTQARAAFEQDTKKNFGIYVRIASLMGFTWIFGFAAPFGWQFLWYPFVILNGLQGVYIALAFALNKRGRGLYKGLLQSCKSRPQQAMSLSNISRTNTQESTCNNESLDISL